MGKALTDIAIADYYNMQSGFTGKNFFSAATGGISFDLSDIGTNWSNNKAADRLDNAIITQYLNDDQTARSYLSQDNYWSIQSGADALNTTGTDSNNDAMIGGTTEDTLDGGAGNDFLFGGDGTDTLTGGEGNDLLIGGVGDDTLNGGAGVDNYIIEGRDTIQDSDGLGLIKDKAGNIITGAIEKRADGSYVFLSDPNISVTKDGNLTLTLTDGSVAVIENFKNGDLGLEVVDAPTIETTYTAEGDPQIHSAEIAPGGAGSDWQIIKTYNEQYGADENGNQVLVSYSVDYYLIDDKGNPTEFGGPKRDDVLHDTAANDHLIGGAGDDRIGDKKGGDDILEGGSGRDLIQGGGGKDILIGGEDGDILSGGSGDDRLYGTSKITTEQAIAQGNVQTGTGKQGDWLSGGAGDDTLVGSAGNDVLTGGSGKDLLIGGAGDDDILGDSDWLAQKFEWTVTDTPQYRRFDPVEGLVRAADSAADVIYAGEGTDHVWGGMGDDVIYGENGNDILSGNSGSDIVFGGEGDDKINGGGPEFFGDTTLDVGDDYLDGGAGNDQLYGEGGSDTVLGGDGEDSAWGGDGNDTLMGGAGDDTLVGDNGDGSGAQGNDSLDGGDGNDKLYGEGGDDNLAGGAGNDTLHGESGDDYLDGGDGTDTLWGGDGDDTIFGGAGDDKLYGESGTNYLDGEDGNDLLDSGGPGSELYGGAGNDDIFAAGGSNYLDGEDGNDTLTAGGGNNTLIGGEGNDTLAAGGGNNYLDGGEGSNTLAAFSGGNTLFAGAGNDTLFAGGGNNYLDAGDGLNTLSADSGSNTLIAGAGDDSLTASGGNNYLDGGDGANTLYADGGKNTLFGGSGDDNLISTGGGSYLDSGAGNDTLVVDGGNNTLLGGAGDDWLQAAEGSDTLQGGAGNDTLIGGDGSDTYLFNRGDGIDTITDNGDVAAFDTLQFGADILQSDVTITRYGNGDLSFKLNGATDEVLISGYYSDNRNRIENIVFGDGTVFVGSGGLPITGSQSNDVLSGSGNSETLLGLAGDDTLNGGMGNNTLDGGLGNDVLDGGAGNDMLIGGEGVDTYLFGFGMGMDTVVDASPGGNLIDLMGGVSFSDLRATQSGNDLLLTMRGTDQGMTLKDYYAISQEWTVQDSTGTQQTMLEVLNATSQDEYSALRDDFFGATKSAVAGNYLADGYQWQADGSLGQSLLGTSVSKTVEQSTSTTTSTMHWFSGQYPDSTSTSNSSSVNATYSTPGWGSSGSNPILFGRQVTFGNSVINTDAAAFDDYSPGMINASSSQWVNAQINWQWAYGVSSTPSESASQNWINGFDPVTGQYGPIGTVSYVTQTLTSHSTQDGQIVAIYPNGTNSSSTTASWLVNNSDSYQFEEIIGGDSDNVISSWNNYAVINGGAGNDVLRGGGLLYGGEGDDTLDGATSQYGGNGNDVLSNGQLLNGGAGNDVLTGGGMLIGGAGNDTMDGGSYGTGDTRYVIDPTQTGIDLIRDTGDSEAAYKDWYYGQLGISNLQLSEQYGGMYAIDGEFGSLPFGQRGGYVFYFTYDQMPSIQAEDPWLANYIQNNSQLVTYIEPLPPIDRPAANDYAALQTIYDAGVIPLDTVEFAAGITLSDLQLSWGEIMQTSPVSGLEERYRTLNLSWNGGASQVQLLIPHSEDPLGSGVEQIKFADNTIVSMQSLIALAPAAVSLDPQFFQYQPGMGAQIMEAGYAGISFGPGISSSMITLGLGSLMLRVGDSGDVIHIENFDPNDALATNTVRNFNFADGTTLNYEQLLSRGFDIYGTTADETLSGTNLVNRIYGVGGNDTLIGTGTSDTLISGVGTDTLIGGTGNETFVVNDAADVVIANASAASNTVLSSVEYVLPDNVQNLTLTGNDNLTAAGNELDNVISGNAGYDMLIAGMGDDTLVAGTGGGMMIGGSGSNIFVLNAANGQQTIIDIEKLTGDTIRFGSSISAKDVVFQQQGSDMLVTYSVNGSALLKNYDLFGTDTPPLISSWQFPDGSSITIVCGENFDGPGSYEITQYDALANQIGKQWAYDNGNHGSNIFGLDGSSSSSSYHSDGSYSHATDDGKGNFAASNFDTNGFLVSDSWGHADGSYGSDTFNADGSGSGNACYVDGSYANIVYDGHGNVSTLVYDASGTKIGDSWTKADGSSRSDVFDPSSGLIVSSIINAGQGGGEALVGKAGQNTFIFNLGDGQDALIDEANQLSGNVGADILSFGTGITSKDVSFQVQGADVLLSYSPNDSILIKNFDLYGFNGTATLFGAYQFSDGSSLTISVGDNYDGAGSFGINQYDALDNLVGEQWGYNDGGHGAISYHTDGSLIKIWQNSDGSHGLYSENSDGSSSETFYEADGSYSIYTNDGHSIGNELDYNASGVKVGDWWNKPDGTYGSDTFNADGSSSGTSYNIDGSYSSYANDGHGTVTSTNFDANGTELNDNWAKADGSSGSDTYNDDGSHRGYSINAAGTSTDSYYNTAGQLTVAYWSNPNGSSGSDTYNDDGSHRGYSINAAGTSTDTYYNTTGQLTSDYWVNASGMQGGDTYTYNTDGAYLQQWRKSDGSSGTLSVNSAGVTVGDSVVNADGSQNVDAGGNHLIVGSTSNDNLVAATGNEILIGGLGNDTLSTGSGSNLIAFNQGDGQDVVNAAAGQNNTVSLGGHFAYNDLALQHNGNDLVLDIGATGSITFKDWYAGNHNIVNLQVIASAMADFNPGSTDILRNSNVEDFDFQKIVTAFDQAQLANPSLSAWGVTDALLDAHLASNDTAALGGDLAYAYGTQGSLTGMGIAAAESTLSSSQFASAPQTLNPWPTLNTGTAQLR